MQLIRKTLAFGQLPSSKGDLYVPDSGRKGFVHNVELHNANTSAETVILNYHDGTSEHQVYKVSVDPDDTVQLDFRGEGSVVDDGAKITGSTTTATQVTYKLSGTEEIPDAVAAGGGAAAGGAESNQWATPETPHAADDEFDGADMSAWSVQNITDAVAGSFSLGAVDTYDTTFNSGDVVRVNLGERESWALVQCPARTKNYCIYKSLTFPTNLLMTARFKVTLSRSQSTADGEFGIFFAGAAAGVPATAKRVWLGGIIPNSSQNRVVTNYWNSGGSVSDVIADGIVDDGSPYPYHYLALHKVGTAYHYWVGSAGGSWVHYLTKDPIDFTPDLVGFFVTNATTGAPGVDVIGIDYLRFYETANFFL